MSTVFRATGRQILEITRLRSLSFALYAWADDQRHHVQDAGSGILVAPNLGLTARHVVKSFAHLDPQLDAINRRSTPLDPQYRVLKVKSEYAILVFQVPRWNDRHEWKARVTWPSFDTDITVMVLHPENDLAIAAAPALPFLEWQLLPPPIGSLVQVFGWPGLEVGIEDAVHTADVSLWVETCRVEEHLSPLVAHGFADFPAYRLHRELPHGFSGGAVIYQGRLAGIFSGPDLVTPLWPLALMTYPDAEDVERSFAQHFEEQSIIAIDWDEVRGRVRRQDCEVALQASRVETRCLRKHVVLMTDAPPLEVEGAT